jgi:hypothetical protein
MIIPAKSQFLKIIRSILSIVFVFVFLAHLAIGHVSFCHGYIKGEASDATCDVKSISSKSYE